MRKDKQKDKNDFQTTIRMPSSVWEEILSITEPRGMTAMEWIRRAIKDGIEREKTGGAPQVSREELKELIKEVLEERKEDRG